MFTFFLSLSLVSSVFGYNEFAQLLSSPQKLTDYPSGSCNVRHFTCMKNEENTIVSIDAFSPYDCCKLCLNTTNCVSWTHYYINNTNSTYKITSFPMCNLYSTYPNDSDHIWQGNCVTGSPYDSINNPKLPNFIYFFPDTIRLESMNVYGHPLDTTPYLNEFAKESVKFNNHFVQHSQCAPSRNIMFSGRYMHTLGHRTQTHLIQSYEPNYLRWLRDSGYYILYLGKNDAFSADTVPQSVNDWRQIIGRTTGGRIYQYGEPGYYSFYYTESKYPGNSTHNKDYEAVLQALDFINNNPIEPFLIFIPGIGAHPVYSGPYDYYGIYNSSQVEKVKKLKPPYLPGKPNYYSKTKGIPYYRGLTSFDSDFFYSINAIYLGLIKYVDWIFGQLWNGLKSSDYYNNTALIFSTDHGDFAGDFNCVEKWPGSLDEVLIHVPLLIRFPNGATNVEINSPTQSFDVLYTILKNANVNIEFNQFGIDLSDEIIKGKEGDLNRYVYSEGGFYYHNELFPNGSDHITSVYSNYWARALEEMSDNGNGSPKCSMIRNLTHKLVYRPTGISEFYDLTSDPDTLYNLWDNNSYSNIRNKMFYDLANWMEITGDTTPILMDNRALPPESVSEYDSVFNDDYFG